MASHSNILVWRIPQIEEAGRLQSMRLQRVGHDWATEHTHTRRNTKCDLLVTPSRIDGQCPINECFHVWAVKQILTLNGIKNVMTTKSLRSLQGKTTPQWLIKIPEWFQRSGGYGIVGTILVARLYMCVCAGTWYQVYFLVNPHKEALSLSHRRGKWNSDRTMDSPRPQSWKLWGWIQSQVSDTFGHDFESSLYLKLLCFVHSTL